MYLYNSQGVKGFAYNNRIYHYVKNLLGDVTDIYCGSTHVVHYAYDAFGNGTVSHTLSTLSQIGNDLIGYANPFRYRSYFWDNDLQLYYLMSRYYDPQTGRFLNADGLEYLDPETLGGLNLYAYCNNNPVNFIDISGHDWNSFWEYIGNEIHNLWTNTVRQWREIPKDLQATLDSLMNNFVFDFGIGVGLGLSTDGTVSVGAGAWMDLFHISVSKDWKYGVAVGYKEYVGFSIVLFDLLGIDISEIDGFRQYGSDEYINNPNNVSSFLGFSFSAYLLIGVSISVGFNLEDLWKDLREIWR